MKVFARLRHSWPQIFVADWSRIAPITDDKSVIKWPRFSPDNSSGYCDIARSSLWSFQKIGSILADELENKHANLVKVCQYYG